MATMNYLEVIYMDLQRLNCTTEELRERICREYEVHADDCIVLFGGRVVRSDANNREIKDKYYQFSCKHRVTKEERMIICGSGAARHFCTLIGEPLPHSMNPFEGNGGSGNGGGSSTFANWNPIRRQLYYAIQLFIIRYQDSLIPGTKIFKILKNVADERYIHLQPKEFLYKGFIDVVTKFNTNMSTIISDLGKHGNLRHFDFTVLSNEVSKLLPSEENIFI